jgi:prevent-host-death family protein
MANYSVAEARQSLPSLIDRALAGEDVVITRRGKVVVELRPASAPATSSQAVVEVLDQLRVLRVTMPPARRTSVELLDLVYDDPDG